MDPVYREALVRRKGKKKARGRDKGREGKEKDRESEGVKQHKVPKKAGDIGSNRQKIY